MAETLGIYVSIPFCRAKCTYCNFASGVFGEERMDAYVERVSEEIRGIRAKAERMGAELPGLVDSIYFGGGTPSLLNPRQMAEIFGALRAEFAVEGGAEITLECAPGQLGQETLEELLRQGMNRMSFGVQSFVDREARAVGRLHTREICLAEIDRMRAAGVANINVDLIAGLPHQTRESWRESVDVALETGVPHVSVYMLEVDEDSRLGREMIAAGNRYGAGATPSEDESAAWYGEACSWLATGGVGQYEISNFARPGFTSRHNMKYWLRESYVGFGLDAHSMLHCGDEAVRWANGDDLDTYLRPAVGSGGQGSDLLRIVGPEEQEAAVDRIGRVEGFEETLFLGLRMNEGVDLATLRARFGGELVDGVLDGLGEVEEAGLVERGGGRLRLTVAGRMVSNEVFGRVLVGA